MTSHATASVTAPATIGFAITPADSDLATPARALWIGTQGHVRVTLVGLGDVILKNAVGLVPVSVKRVWATNTTAADIVGLA